MKRQLLLILLITLNLSVVCFGYLNCKTPGTYFITSNDPIDEGCNDCTVGRYCPGDDYSYGCPPGTIAPKGGMDSCIACNTVHKKTDYLSRFCLFNDTPIDSKADDKFFYDYDKKFKLTNKFGYYFNIMDTYYLSKLESIRYRFYPYNSSYSSIPLIVVASTLTGQPSERNYQWKSQGIYPDVNIPIDEIDISKNTIIQLSFAIINTQFELNNEPYIGTVVVNINSKEKNTKSQYYELRKLKLN